MIYYCEIRQAEKIFLSCLKSTEKLSDACLPLFPNSALVSTESHIIRATLVATPRRQTGALSSTPAFCVRLGTMQPGSSRNNDLIENKYVLISNVAFCIKTNAFTFRASAAPGWLPARCPRETRTLLFMWVASTKRSAACCP